MKGGKLLLFFEKIVFFTKYFSSRYFGQLMRYEYQIDRNKTKQFVLSGRISDLFLILIILLATKSKVRNTFFLKKRFVFRISENLLQHWIHLSNLSWEKKIKKNKNRKINFWPIFFLFIYFFIIFFKKLFYFWEILKMNYRFWRVVVIPIQRFQQIWATISNGGPGGRLAPPASKCHKKNVWKVGSRTLPQFV